VWNTCGSHWGIAIRLKVPPSPKEIKKAKANNKTPKSSPDEIMVFHLIHSSRTRGQVGRFGLEEFWLSDCRIRINNTTNGHGLYNSSRLILKKDVLQHALTAFNSSTMKWQTCADFIRWSSEEITDPCHFYQFDSMPDECCMRSISSSSNNSDNVSI